MISKWYTAILIIFYTTVGLSQPYQPLLESDNEWHFTTCYNSCITDIYYTNSNTLVNGLSYKILDGYHYISRTFLLREEVAEKKVYLTKINPNRIDTYLLYDFSLQEGDTFEMKNPITPFPTEGGLFVLDSIRNQTFQENETRRYFYFSPHPENTISENNAVWIEGVGSLSIINAPGGYPDLNSFGSLTCFYKNTQLFYTDEEEETPECELTLLNTPEQSVSPIEIQFSASLKELFIKGELQPKSIAIYSLLGQSISEIPKGNGNIWSLQNITIPNGIYFLKLSFDNQDYTLKIAWKENN